MKIRRTMSSIDPSKCFMNVKGFFGNVKGEVKYFDYGSEMLQAKTGYFVVVGGQAVGAATDFYHACDMLLDELKIIKTVCV